MSTEIALPAEAIPDPLSMKAVTELLVKHYELHEGFYDLLVQFNIGLGAVGPDVSSRSPGAMISLAKMGLIRSSAESGTAVDAGVVNPPSKLRKAKVAKKS